MKPIKVKPRHTYFDDTCKNIFIKTLVYDTKENPIMDHNEPVFQSYTNQNILEGPYIKRFHRYGNM